MTNATTDFFEGLAARGHEPLLDATSGTLRIDAVDGRRVEHWYVAVRNGDVDVSHSNTDADAVLKIDSDLLARMVGGSANAMAAMLRGDLDVDGDLRLLLSFQRLFPGPPASRGQ
jgi:putative sterol carrier protein